MRLFAARLILSAFAIGAGSVSASAGGLTERACLQSDRSPGAEVCSCVQALADRVLTSGDQRDAARIIADPDLYLEFKYGGSAASQDFLTRYRRWGELSAELCTPRGRMSAKSS